jgi:hypothetical protein
MPIGNPEAYMAEGVPEGEAMMMAGMPPASLTGDPDGMDVPAQVPDQDGLMMMLLDAVTQKWGAAEAQISAEKDILLQTLMRIAMPAPQPGPQDFVEGTPMGPVG